MITFGNLSDGYNSFGQYFTDHGSPVSEIWESRGLPLTFIDIAYNALNIFTFSYEVFIALFVLELS